MTIRPSRISDRAELVGAVMAGFDGTRGWIHHLAVSVECRLQGVGTTLMGAAESGLREFGCPKVNLQVGAHNEAVIAFYRTQGYGVEDLVSMGKMLGDSEG